MTTILTQTGTITIPQEVYGLICQDAALTQRDLLALCTVFYSFQVETERILYSSAKLGHMWQIKFFCDAISRRPHLAQCLRKLVLVLSRPAYFHLAADISRVKDMLHLATNLQDLRVSCHNTGLIVDTSTQSKILEGHAFKLTAFVNTYFNLCDIAEFVKSQPTIQTYVMQHELEPANPSLLKEVSLPNLKNLALYSDDGLRRSMPMLRLTRPLERLQLVANDFDVHYMDKLLRSSRSHTSLRSLSIVVSHPFTELTTIANGVMGCVPDIKLLEIIVGGVIPCSRSCATSSLDFSAYGSLMCFHQVRIGIDDMFLFESESTFTQLETLVLRVPTLHATDITRWLNIRTEELRMLTAGSIMQSLPTLRRLVLIGSYNLCHEYLRTLHGDIIVGGTTECQPLSVTLNSLSALNALETAEWINWQD